METYAGGTRRTERAYRKEQYIRRKQMHHPDSNDAEEVVVPSVAALAGILLTGLLYLVLPSNGIIGPNWLLLVVEGVCVVPLVIDVMTAWNLSHTARRILVLVPLGLSTLALVVGVALFILTLPTDKHATNLLRAAALLWSFNILFFAFTGATALSPADTYPLTRLAKGLMMVEALLSLTVVGILISRAVNILGG